MLSLQYGSKKEGVLGACAVVFFSESSYSWSVSFPLLESLCESLFVTLLISFLLPLSDNIMWVLYPCLCALNWMCVCMHTHMRAKVQRCAMAAEEWGIFFLYQKETPTVWCTFLTKLFRNGLLSLFPSQHNSIMKFLQCSFIYTPFHGFRNALLFMKNLTQWHWALENQITQHHSQSHHTWSMYEWITLCYHFPLISTPIPFRTGAKP